jgi:serine/threonine protein kinase
MVVRQVGHGAMGVVYEVIDTRTQARYAVKLLNAALAGDPAAVDAMAREVAAAQAVTHQHLLKVNYFADSGPYNYLVMEYLDGADLATHLARRGGKLPVEEGLRILRQVAAGLDHLHDIGLVHQDLKPQNIFVTVGGEVRILDYGIAKVVRAHGAPGAQASGGTLAYMAPEQLRGEAVDRRTDVYAFGLVCVEVLTRKLPFDVRDAKAVVAWHLDAEHPIPDVGDPALHHFLTAALSPDPAQRPVRLANLEAGQPVPRQPPQGPSRLPPPPVDEVRPKPTEAASWAEAQRQNTALAYRTFLELWPNGAHTGEAQRRLEALRAHMRPRPPEPIADATKPTPRHEPERRAPQRERPPVQGPTVFQGAASLAVLALGLSQLLAVDGSGKLGSVLIVIGVILLPLRWSSFGVGRNVRWLAGLTCCALLAWSVPGDPDQSAGGTGLPAPAGTAGAPRNAPAGWDNTPGKSIEVYEQDCARGDVRGCREVANWEAAAGMYDRARSLYEGACNAGDLLSCSHLGGLYIGGLGVGQDFERARVLKQRACDGGIAVSCADLAEFYQIGMGVPADTAQARALYRRACEGGITFYCNLQ